MTIRHTDSFFFKKKENEARSFLKCTIQLKNVKNWYIFIHNTILSYIHREKEKSNKKSSKMQNVKRKKNKTYIRLEHSISVNK